jgi:predicted ester cyclase
MSVEETRRVLEAYFSGDHGDVSTLADDAVFRVMSTGEEHRGPEAIKAMLDYFYRQVFEADAHPRNLVVGEGSAAGEWDFVGRHIGEFAGVPATGKEVNIPLCVCYDGRQDRGGPHLLRSAGIPGASRCPGLSGVSRIPWGGGVSS